MPVFENPRDLIDANAGFSNIHIVAANTMLLDQRLNNVLKDLFVMKMQGKTHEGRIVADLKPTGTLPTFAHEASEQAMNERIRLTGALWKG